MTMTANANNDGGRRVSRWRIGAWSAAALVLLLPLIAMQFTDEVKWDAADFVFAGVLLLGIGIPFELAVRKTGDVAYKAAVGVALLAGEGTLLAAGRALEERLGLRLFRRTTRSIALTDAGRDYLQSIEGFQDLKPGDYGSIVFEIAVDTNPAWVFSCLDFDNNVDNGLNAPESRVDDTDVRTATFGEKQFENDDVRRFSSRKMRSMLFRFPCRLG